MNFFKFDETIGNWNSSLEIKLNFKAAKFKFDDFYLIVMNYFNTIDLYSVKTGELLRNYKGHDAGITASCYNSDLKLLITGSCDNTVKFWNINLNKEDAIKILDNIVWPLEIRIEKYLKTNYYLIMCIDAHFTLHLTFIDGSNKSLKFLNNNLKLNLTLGSNIEISDIISSYDKRLSLLRLFYLCKKKDRNENTNYYFLNPNKYFCSEWFTHIKNDKLMTNQNFLIERQFNFHRKVLNFGKPLNNLNEFIPVEDLKLLTFGKRY